jgi:mannose-6-phosphate isomerase-like protein (cupin superfamily)
MFSARNKEKIELLQDCLKHKKRRKSEEIYYTASGRRQMWRRGGNTGQKDATF